MTPISTLIVYPSPRTDPLPHSILALASTVLAFGQLYTLLPVKPVFLLSFVVFTAGSVTCAIAPSSLIFIVGRAVAGLGGAGIFSGASMYGSFFLLPPSLFTPSSFSVHTATLIR